MKFDHPLSTQEIIELTGAQIIYDAKQPILGANELNVAEDSDLVFVDHPKYFQKALDSAASCVILNEKIEYSGSKTILFHTDPFSAFTSVLNQYRSTTRTKVFNNSAGNIDASSIIQPGVFIDEHVQIGKNCLIHSGVVIYDHVHIGDNVIIHANTVVGSDAFYYNKKSSYRKFTSAGTVIIEDNVEIGALCTIDKGATGLTKIGKGTKIDNQVHIGHDTIIGEHCLFASGVGIAGVCSIGNNVTLWGQVGVSSKISIEDNVTVLAQSGVSKTLKKGGTYFGSPAVEARQKMKEMATLRSISKSKP